VAGPGGGLGAGLGAGLERWRERAIGSGVVTATGF